MPGLPGPIRLGKDFAMDIHRLKVFASVYRNRSFSRASEDLHLSQPTISEHIKSLEEGLGFRLFDRLGRTISPTHQAVILYPRALEIIEKLESLKTALEVSGDEPRGELLIGASTIPGTYILPRMAASFRQSRPQVAFSVLIEDSGRVARLVAAGDLFLGLVGARMLERGIIYRPLVEDELLLVARKGMVPEGTVTPGMLREQNIPFILREEGSGTKRTMEHYFRDQGVTLDSLHVVATLGSTAAVKEAVKAGLGVSTLSRLAVREELARGSLVSVALPDLRMHRTFYVITRKGRTLPPTYQLFLDYLLAGEARE